VDIRRQFSIQCDYEVLTDRYPLHPNFHLLNEESVCVFVSSDGYMKEAQQPKKPGLYRSTVTIPGNFMSEGMFSIDFAISTLDPVIIHVLERGLFSFSVHDPGEGDSARGTYAGPMPGAVRPMLPWKTERLGTIVNLREEGEA
jgi:lipopolysaccharide transport system ATP-binding protein